MHVSMHVGMHVGMHVDMVRGSRRWWWAAVKRSVEHETLCVERGKLQGAVKPCQGHHATWRIMAHIHAVMRLCAMAHGCPSSIMHQHRTSPLSLPNLNIGIGLVRLRGPARPRSPVFTSTYGQKRKSQKNTNAETQTEKSRGDLPILGSCPRGAAARRLYPTLHV